ncbi:hypothetical protein IAU60_001909 [Kwoniella sp. DSM 27419]
MSAPTGSTTYQYPAGQLGHLTADQQAAFDEFKRVSGERGVYKEGSPPSHDDATLLRYLRARRFQVEPAVQHFSSTEQYRQQNRLIELYDEMDVDEYEQARRLFIGRRDRRGFPITLFEVAKLDMKAVTAYERATGLSQATTSAKMLRLFALYEFFSRFVSPWCSSVPTRPHYPTPITQGTNVVDISGMGLKQYWDLRAHLQDSSSLSAAHYPETLNSIVVIGAPSFFSTIWSWIKKFIDPGVVAKIHICPSSPSEMLAALTDMIDIESIPKKYGGQLEWGFGDMPALDPVLLDGFTWAEGWSALPIGPVKWQPADGKMQLVAVGKQNGVARREVIGTLDRSYQQVFYP